MANYKTHFFGWHFLIRTFLINPAYKPKPIDISVIKCMYCTRCLIGRQSLLDSLLGLSIKQKFKYTLYTRLYIYFPPLPSIVFQVNLLLYLLFIVSAHGCNFIWQNMVAGLGSTIVKLIKYSGPKNILVFFHNGKTKAITQNKEHFWCRLFRHFRSLLYYISLIIKTSVFFLELFESEKI